MGVRISVDNEEVFSTDANVPMIHVFTPTGEAATLRCQGDSDVTYEINLVLDPAQGGIYLDEIEQAEKQENRDRLEGQEVAGTNGTTLGVVEEEVTEETPSEEVTTEEEETGLSL